MPVQGQPTLLEHVREIVTTYKGTVGDGMSIADIAKIARVEPITLISSSLAGTKELYQILHGVLNIYAAYYLQATSILGTQLHDSRVLKILDKTNPDRDLKTFLTAGQIAFESMSAEHLKPVRTLSLSNCKYRLPMLQTDTLASMESLSTDDFGIDKEFDEAYSLSSSVAKIESFDKLGMTVGKVIEVNFSTGSGDTRSRDKNTKPGITIPAVIKLDTMVIPSDAIQQIVIGQADEITLSSRFRDALAGRISFIKDFLLCSDLIRAQKKTMIKDPTGFYAQLLKRVNNSKMYSALSGNISLAGISAIYVLSEDDEAQIQKRIGGRLTNAKTREIVFNNSSAMMIVVVDREWERVSIYVRDMDGFSQNSFDSFKESSKRDNDQIADMIKAFAVNTPPSF